MYSFGRFFCISTLIELLFFSEAMIIGADGDGGVIFTPIDEAGVVTETIFEYADSPSRLTALVR
jgi:hypothetical protein